MVGVNQGSKRQKACGLFSNSCTSLRILNASSFEIKSVRPACMRGTALLMNRKGGELAETYGSGDAASHNPGLAFRG